MQILRLLAPQGYAISNSVDASCHSRMNRPNGTRWTVREREHVSSYGSSHGRTLKVIASICCVCDFLAAERWTWFVSADWYRCDPWICLTYGRHLSFSVSQRCEAPSPPHLQIQRRTVFFAEKLYQRTWPYHALLSAIENEGKGTWRLLNPMLRALKVKSVLSLPVMLERN